MYKTWVWQFSINLGKFLCITAANDWKLIYQLKPLAICLKYCVKIFSIGLLYLRKTKLLGVLSPNRERCGLLIISPCLNTRSIGALVAGTDRTHMASGKILFRRYLCTDWNLKPLLDTLSPSLHSIRQVLSCVEIDLSDSVLCHL